MTDSKQLITALKAYIKRKDLGLRETAGIIGVSPSTLSHWLSADSVTIHSFNRRQLREVLGGSEALTPKRAVVSAPDVGPVMVATLGVARASTYTPSVESIGEFLDAFEDKTAWVTAQPKHFALIVEGDSMSPEYPDGSLLLVASGDRPQRGDLVVARLADEDAVIVKYYDRRDNVVTLRSLHPDGRNFTIDTKDAASAANLVWMFPVDEAQIPLRRRRWLRKGKEVQESV